MDKAAALATAGLISDRDLLLANRTEDLGSRSLCGGPAKAARGAANVIELLAKGAVVGKTGTRTLEVRRQSHGAGARPL
jgi:hypothetical protein